jgi:ABC-type Mn2+/Zn2+ transport system permease subunit
MENKTQTSITHAWPWAGLLLIVLAIGPSILGIQLQTSPQMFIWGVLTGLAIVYFGAFISQAGKEWFGKRP